MVSYKTKRILPVILVIVIVIVAVVALVSLARAVFFNDSPSNSAETIDVSQQSLLNTAADRSVRMTVRGPIVAEENFKSYRISISPDARSLTTYVGYLDSVVDQTVLGNNSAAYTELVYALDRANMSKGKAFEGEADDTRGICATGRVYEFDIINGGNIVKHLWTSTCSGSKGSLDANKDQLGQLFVNQIPDAGNTIRRINL